MRTYGGTQGQYVYKAHPHPTYDGQTMCVGVEAVIDGLRYSTLKATLLAGPDEKWNLSYEAGAFGARRLYKTPSGRFFIVANGDFTVLSEIAARDVFGNHWKKHVSEQEAFGTLIQEA